ncbi:helix-turn-helix domain-containing protein [Nocardia sp. NBC_01503]|uniref:helix-turn-helix domain-containing protein n=1 Tax=Nocardia sp. NBC_01503 TaxID=2975997 RepID=UPI002E7ADBB8|nr:helix-turn-helix transcriptional regulator [Nocardia sp. NBC_01503]WTL33429.1 helix-turn-helix domain-containing protein [Nocardia sp. NBC_01503]
MAGTTVPRRAFGRFLRALRNERSLLSAGLHADTSKQTVMRMEEGLPTKLSTPQLERLLDFYAASPSERAEALELWDEVRRLAKAAKEQGTHKGWWQSYAGQYGTWFDHYLKLETGARRMTSHQLVLMPGILQTSEYRRAIINATVSGLSAVDIERRLELAARRQARLTDDDLHLDAFVSESVLLHQPGGAHVMAGQLQRLAELSERSNVSIRAVPHGVGMYPGLVVQSFTLLDFPPTTSRLVEPPVIYTEGPEGALYLERDDVIARYRQAIDGIQQVALTEDDTRKLVLKIAKEYAA